MKLSIKIEPTLEEATVTIETPEMNDEIQQLVQFIKGLNTPFLIGKKGEKQHVLKPEDIHYFHTENESVIAVTKNQSYQLKEKLYELEQLLSSKKFIRISKSVIVNLIGGKKNESIFKTEPDWNLFRFIRCCVDYKWFTFIW